MSSLFIDKSPIIPTVDFVNNLIGIDSFANTFNDLNQNRKLQKGTIANSLIGLSTPSITYSILTGLKSPNGFYQLDEISTLFYNISIGNSINDQFGLNTVSNVFVGNATKYDYFTGFEINLNLDNKDNLTGFSDRFVENIRKKRESVYTIYDKKSNLENLINGLFGSHIVVFNKESNLFNSVGYVIEHSDIVNNRNCYSEFTFKVLEL